MLRFFWSWFFQLEFQPSHTFVDLAFLPLLNTFQIPTWGSLEPLVFHIVKKSPTLGCKSTRRQLSKPDRVKMEKQNFIEMFECFYTGSPSPGFEFRVCTLGILKVAPQLWNGKQKFGLKIGNNFHRCKNLKFFQSFSLEHQKQNTIMLFSFAFEECPIHEILNIRK